MELEDPFPEDAFEKGAPGCDYPRQLLQLTISQGVAGNTLTQGKSLLSRSRWIEERR